MNTLSTEGCEEIQTNLDMLTNWAEQNGIKINVKKSHILPPSRNQNYVPFTLPKEILPWDREDKSKDLGMIITKSLQINAHSAITTK